MKHRLPIFLLLLLISVVARSEKTFDRWVFADQWQQLSGPVYITAPARDFYVDYYTGEMTFPNLQRYATMRIFGIESKRKPPLPADFMLRGDIDSCFEAEGRLCLMMTKAELEMTDSLGSRYTFDGEMSVIFESLKTSRLEVVYLTFTQGILTIDDWTTFELPEPLTVIVATELRPRRKPVLQVATHD